MTVSEFWHLKYGTVVEYVASVFPLGWQGVVVHREVHDDVCGFVMTSRGKMRDIKTGRKYLEITLETENGSYRYVQSDNLSVIKKLFIKN